MKKTNNSKVKTKEKKSFQSQLFFIVLVIFILFIFIEYLLVDFVLEKRYINSQVESNTSSIIEFKDNLNEDNLLSSLNDLNNNTRSIPLVISKDGGLHLKESKYSSYIITLDSDSVSYEVEVNDLDLEFEIDNTIEYAYLEVIDNTNYLKCFKYNDLVYSESEISNSYIRIDNAKIIKIEKPDNINFLYRNNESINNSLDIIFDNIQNVKDTKDDSIKYYIDESTSTLYYTVSYESLNNDFILIVINLVETSSLNETISLYYGYVAILSVVVAVLIALFISRAFSKPIKLIEKEMNKLSTGDYTNSNYEFKNSELTSLQDTLNSVKDETKERVLLLESQKMELEKANSRILNEEELRKSFIARLSHELKTPLMVIGATTEAMMDGIIDKKDLNKEYNNILKELEKSNKIIKDIIDSYKTTSKSYKLNITRFSLNELTSNVIKSLKPLIEKNSLILSINSDEEIYISADDSLIKEVIDNYLTNAFKYTKSGSLVEINIKENKKEILFEVKNYGSKIEKENLDKIWLPFFREKENVDSVSTGMGLYIVKEILEAHKFNYGIENFKDGVKSYFKIKK